MKKVWAAGCFVVLFFAGCSDMPESWTKLDGPWLFSADSSGAGMEEAWFAPDYDRSHWKTGTVPKYLDRLGLPGYVGSVWFARQFEADEFARPLSIVFQGVDDDAEIWINGQPVGFHAGYSEEFSFDISASLKKGANLIVVRTDNTGGPGGIYKSVFLCPAADVARLLRSPLADERARKSEEWVRNGVLYEVSVRSFSKEGTFRALEKRLPELNELGVTILWLMPIHPVGELNRKGEKGSPYSIADYYEIAPEYGTKEDFRSLVSSVHQEGMRIILDLVANHTSWDSKLMIEHPDWFTRDEEGAILSPNADWFDVADLDYDQHELRKYMIDMMKYWVREFDIDGFRCDVAELVPADFWIRAREEVEHIKPIMMLAEGNLPEYHLEAFDVTYAWNTYTALGQVLAGTATPEIFHRQIEKERSRFPQGSIRLRFLTNHDKNLYDAPARERYGGEGTKAAAALVRCYPGLPLMFNGEEIGSRQRLDHHERSVIAWGGGESFRAFYTKLGRIYGGHQCLRTGAYQPLAVSEPSRVLGFARTENTDSVVVFINFSGNEARVTADVPFHQNLWTDALTGRTLKQEGNRLAVHLPPYGVSILGSHDGRMK